MPIGSAPNKTQPSGPDVAPRLVGGLGGGVDTPIPAQIGAGTQDLWQHLVANPSDVGTNAVPGTVFRADSDFTLVVFEVVDVVTVFIGLNRNPTDKAGGYDLRHPGGGILRFPVPTSQWIGLSSDVALTNPIDFYLMAGTYASRT